MTDRESPSRPDRRCAARPLAGSRPRMTTSRPAAFGCAPPAHNVARSRPHSRPSRTAADLTIPGVTASCGAHLHARRHQRPADSAAHACTPPDNKNRRASLIAFATEPYRHVHNVVTASCGPISAVKSLRARPTIDERRDGREAGPARSDMNPDDGENLLQNHPTWAKKKYHGSGRLAALQTMGNDRFGGVSSSPRVACGPLRYLCPSAGDGQPRAARYVCHHPARPPDRCAPDHVEPLRQGFRFLNATHPPWSTKPANEWNRACPPLSATFPSRRAHYGLG